MTEKKSDYYFFTFTLNPKYYELLPKQQYRLTYEILKETLSKHDNTTVAEITEKFNIHYHSIIIIQSEKQLFHLIKRVYAMINTCKYMGRTFHYFPLDKPNSLQEKIEYLKKGSADAYEYEYTHIVNDDFDLYNHFIKPSIKIVEGTSKLSKPLKELINFKPDDSMYLDIKEL